MIDERIVKTCPVRYLCKQHGKMCNTLCPLWIDTRYQVEMAQLPRKYTRWTLDRLPRTGMSDDLNTKLTNWEATDVQRISEGQGLYLFGGTGSGKTTAVGAISMNFIVKKSLADMRSGARTRQLVQYANVPELLDLLKRGFDDPDVAAMGAHIIERLMEVPLAVLDDIGSEKPSEWARERLLTVINRRHDEELSTLFTSNLSLDELEVFFGGIQGRRLRSRIEGMTIPLPMYGIDRRRTL